MKKIFNFGVCEGRHEMPVDGYIFPGEITAEEMKDPEGLTKRAHNFFMNAFAGLEETTRIISYGYDDIHITIPDCEVKLYATGLTVAVLAAVKALHQLCVPVTVMHYDRESGDYFKQWMF